ncbi:polysaccharide pyruvyl transferase family protein [Botrimarina sp.]|uniref:polysaccharide pyruvyl transferase family protein n=1 Tax=Botrimarina sp. TaxID=2795802 RepID=UPI0032ED4985
MFERLRAEGQIVHYFPNPGNAGDALIMLAAVRLFSKYRVPYVIEKTLVGFNPAGKVVVYGGGGNLGSESSPAAEFLTHCNSKSSLSVLLPHTVTGCEQLLRSLGPGTVLYCREVPSYQHVVAHAGGCEIALAEDLALQLDAEEILTRSPPFSVAGRLLRRLFSDLANRPGRQALLPKGPTVSYFKDELLRTRTLYRGDCLICMRSDHERTPTPVPYGNWDLPARIPFAYEDVRSAEWACHTLLTRVKHYREVRTNRLHVTIAAALLGKSVRMYANSYYKNRAVFEFSLRHRFPCVQWEDS